MILNLDNLGIFSFLEWEILTQSSCRNTAFHCLLFILIDHYQYTFLLCQQVIRFFLALESSAEFNKSTHLAALYKTIWQSIDYRQTSLYIYNTALKNKTDDVKTELFFIIGIILMKVWWLKHT